MHKYATANNRYMKYYNKNKDLSYFIYWGATKLYEWTMSQK